MKILAISGRNLASLAGPFSVDLVNGPLGRAGLFAIHGETGSGKSTLLDAVCLALYGETPRSESAGSATLTNSAGETWTAKDPRHLVRRGCSDALARVVFSVDDETFQAEWSVAAVTRGPRKGQLDTHRMRLGRLASGSGSEPEWLVMGPDACRAFVEKRTGMGFDNFCRSVLLAQGRFAALLEAKASDRAKVLEALTDPRELYRRLSKAAHKRGSESGDKLKRAQAEVDAITLLPDAERQALRDSVATAQNRFEQLRRATVEIGRQVDAWEAIDRAQVELRTQEDAHQAAIDGLGALKHERQIVDEAASVAHLVEPQAAVVRAEAAHERARTDRTTAEDALDTASRAHEVAEAAANTARAACEASASRREQLSPDLQRARDLDNTMALLRSQRPGRAKAVQELADRRKLLEQGARDDASGRSDLTKQAKTEEEWFSSHPNARPLARDAGTWQQLLRVFLEEDRAITSETIRLGELEAALENAETSLAAAKQALLDSQKTRATAEADVATAEDEARQLLGLLAPAHLARLQADTAKLERLESEAQRLSELTSTEATERDLARQHADRATAAQLERATAEDKLRALKASRADLIGQQALARNQADMAQLRARLSSGQPCAVCGSCEHPWADPAAIVEVDAVEAELGRVEAAIEAETSIRDRASERWADETARAEASERNASQIAAERSRRLESWAAEARSITGLAHGASPEVVLPSLRTLVSVNRAEVEAITQKANLAKAAQDRAREARTTLGNAGQQVATTIDVRAKRETERDLAKAALETAGRQLEGRKERRERAWWEAAAVLADVGGAEQAFRNAPAATLARWTQLVTDCAAHERERTRLNEELQRLDAADDKRRAALHEIATQEAPLRLDLESHDASIDRHRRERAALLKDRPVADVETELADEQRQREQERTQASDRANTAAMTLAAAKATAEAASAASQKAEAEVATALEQLEQAAEPLPFDLSEANRRLGLDPAEVARCEGKLDESARHAEACRVRADVARERHVKALAQCPQRDRSTLAGERERFEAEASSLERFVGERNGTLTKDAQAAELKAQKEATRKLLEQSEGVWGRLAEVIGSSAGDSFATYAQSLAFASLLSAANREVARLRPRYQLLVLPSADQASPSLEMLVSDREFGGDHRPLSTLSGGERFLVSLSLALGLSSLSARNHLLGTLFIDEGFGTLDPATLAVAEDALRTLQQRGTQVGIISHVPELAGIDTPKVLVERVSEGLSRIRVVAGAAAR